MKVHPRDMGAKSSKPDNADFTDLQTLRQENETLKQKLSELQQDVKDWQDKYTDANDRAERVETRVRELEAKYEQEKGEAAGNGDVRRNSKQEMPQYLEKVKLVAQMKIKMKQHRQLLQETNVRNGSVATKDSRRPTTNSHSNGKAKQVRVWPAPKVVTRTNGTSKTYPAAKQKRGWKPEEKKTMWMP